MKRILNSLALTALAAACGEPTNTTNTTSSSGAATQQGVSCDGDVCVLSGTLLTNLTLTADKQWLLRGGVFVGNDVSPVTLTIQPGTRIYGETSTNGMLVVTRGARLQADGTASSPIIFTSSKTDGTRARGDWGGLILNGRAPINGCTAGSTCEGFGEGGTGYYGGTDAADNSGTLRYVRIEFAGRLISPENELNGLALQGVGTGTTLDFIQIHMGKDDCIEFFGGTVNAKHILCTGIADDNLDWTDGWNGKLQFFVAQQYEDAGDNGIEGDNNAEANATTPRSHPVLSNLTLIGQAGSEQSDLGILLREGTAANLHNAIVLGFNEACLDVDHTETFTNALSGTSLTGELTIENSILSCATNFKVDSGEPMDLETFYNLNGGNALADPGLASPFDLLAPNFRPMAGGAAMTMTVDVPNDPFFSPVTFRGGVDPNDDWTAGWTTSARN